MKRSTIELLVTEIINLKHADWRTVRRHETRINKFKASEFSELACYFLRARDAGNEKNIGLLAIADKLVSMFKQDIGVYNGILNIIKEEREKLHPKKERFDAKHYKAKRALYARRYRAKKSGRLDGDDPAVFLAERQKTQRLVDAGLPRPKSLTHAQKMKAELDAYIAVEELEHGTGNTSDPRNNKEYTDETV